MLENLTILLENVQDCGSTATTDNLPTNSDVMKALTKGPTSIAASIESTKVNQMCVVVWQEDIGYQWYIGYIKEWNSSGTLSVDHLTRALKNSDSKWKYPSHELIQEASSEQIIKCYVEGDWDLAADSRKRLFCLTNINTILCAFKLHIES